MTETTGNPRHKNMLRAAYLIKSKRKDDVFQKMFLRLEIHVN